MAGACFPHQAEEYCTLPFPENFLCLIYSLELCFQTPPCPGAAVDSLIL